MQTLLILCPLSSQTVKAWIYNVNSIFSINYLIKSNGPVIPTIYAAIQLSQSDSAITDPSS